MCHACKHGGRAGLAAYKRLERRRAAARDGRVPGVPHRPVSAEQRVHRARVALLRKLLGLVVRLHTRKARSADAARWGIMESSVKWRRRYERDPEFREWERLRTRDKKLRLSGIKLAASDGSLTAKALVRLFARARRCAYCRVVMRSRDKSLDHVVPLSRGGAHSILNVVISCKRCNARKHARHQRTVTRPGSQLMLTAR